MQRIDLLPYVLDAQHKANEWITWVLNTQVSIAAVLGLTLFIVLLYVLEYRWYKRDIPMTAHNKQMVQLALADALTELYLAEQLSIKDYHYWSHRIAYDFDMPAMKVRKIVKKRLAKYLRAQYLERQKKRKTNGDSKPSPVPGPKPMTWEEIQKGASNSNVDQLKRFFSKFA